MTDTEIHCPNCKSAAVQTVQEALTATSKGGVTAAFVDEWSLCESCGEEFHTYEQSRASSRAFTTAVSKQRRLMVPDDIRQARFGLHMTLTQMEAAMGTGPKTYLRWEAGTVAPGMAANGLLWVAAHYPAVFLEYAASRGIRPERKVALEGPGKIVASISYAPTEDSPPVVLKRGKGVQYGLSENASGQTVAGLSRQTSQS